MKGWFFWLNRLIPAVSVLAVGASAPVFAPKTTTAAEASAERQRQVSNWGAFENGLQMRVWAPAEIEQGMPLTVNIELRSTPERLPPDVKKLNVFLRDTFLELVLTNRQTQESWRVTPYDPSAGMRPGPDTGEWTIPLDRTNMESWAVDFPLVKLYEKLDAARYDCTVRFTYPQAPHRSWRGDQAEWEDAGFWHGTLLSGQFPLKLLQEAPKVTRLIVPKTLRLRREMARLTATDADETPVPAVYFDRRDTEEILVPVRNGHFTGTCVYRGGERLTLSGLLKADDVNSIDVWYDYKGGDENVSYTIEVFETAERPQHMWMPGPGAASYVVLWKKTFDRSFSEDEIRKAISGAADEHAK